MWTKTIEEIRAFVLASLGMTEESLGTGTLEIVKEGSGLLWALRYADSCGTFEGAVVENADETLTMDWDES